MSKKILVTCPPMLAKIDTMGSLIETYNFEITTPNVVQTLSERELIEILPDHDGWIIGDDPATARVFEAGIRGRFKAAVKWGVGVDNVDFGACERLGIPITNTPGMFGDEVADLALCYVIGLARDAFYIDRSIRGGSWPKPTGISLKGRVAGVIGLGDIGQCIAQRLQAVGMEVIGWDPRVKEPSDDIRLYSWPDQVECCDFLVLACSLNEGTRGIIGTDLLPRLKRGVRVVNVSRGGLIDEAALVDGLERGVIDSAALDVFEVEPLHSNSRLRGYPRLIFGSHNGSNTEGAVYRTSERALDLLSTYLNAR